MVALVLVIGVAYFAHYNLQHLGQEYIIYIPDNEEQEDLPMAPDILIYDAHGNEVWLSDFLGRPVVLNFWATWCPSCGHESPHFEALYNELGNEIELLKVVLKDGVRETRSRVDMFMQQYNYTFPLFFDTSGQASLAYGVTHIPRTFFITREGYVAAHIQGAATEESLMVGVERIK